MATSGVKPWNWLHSPAPPFLSRGIYIRDVARFDFSRFRSLLSIPNLGINEFQGLSSLREELPSKFFSLLFNPFEIEITGATFQLQFFFFFINLHPRIHLTVVEEFYEICSYFSSSIKILQFYEISREIIFHLTVNELFLFFQITGKFLLSAYSVFNSFSWVWNDHFI